MKVILREYHDRKMQYAEVSGKMVKTQYGSHRLSNSTVFTNTDDNAKLAKEYNDNIEKIEALHELNREIIRRMERYNN